MLVGVLARRNGVLRVLLLSALLVRALLPPGFMLAEAADRSVKIVLCSAHGSVEAYFDPVTKEISYEPAKKKQSADKIDPPCAFSAIAKLAPPPGRYEIAARHAGQHHRGVPDAVRPGRGLSAPPPPSTGPPFHIA